MNANISAITEQLSSNRLLRDVNEVAKFEDALQALNEQEDINLIPNFCEGFDDETQHHGVTFGIVHAIESLYHDDTKDYCNKIFLLVIEKDIMLPHAKEWLEILIIRTLNDQGATESLITEVNSAEGHTKEILAEITDKLIKEDKDQFESNGSKLLEAIR